MIIKYDTSQLKHIINDIHILTNLSLSILDTDYNTIAESSLKQEYCMVLQSIGTEKDMCQKCDKNILNKCKKSQKLEKHICHSGLYDFAMPIIKNDITVGYLVMGQVRSDMSPKKLNYSPKTDNKTLNKLKSLYDKIPYVTKESLDAVCDIIPRILLSNLVSVIYDPVTADIVKYIDKNIAKKITVNELCNKFFISKNRLYKLFNENLSNSVTSYINEKKITYAKSLIKDTNDSFYKIAEKTGIEDYTYFTKLFKKHTGLTPSEYKTGIK